MSKVIYKSVVLDNEDTHLLGRIRCKPSDWKIDSILQDLDKKGILDKEKNDVLDKYKYTNQDPFVFMPLLPLFIDFTPQVDEQVWLIFSNPEENWGKREQFYISVIKSNPFNLKFEDGRQSQVMTNEGVNIALGPGYKSPELPNLPPGTEVSKRKFPQREYAGDGKKMRGIFSEPNDNAIYGQGSTDIILKEDEILIRAGKTDMTPNQVNVPNRQRAFLQMSYFKTEAKTKDPITDKISKIDETPLRNLIEYQINNLENSFDLFNGFIRIYDLGPKFNIKNNEFTTETEIDLSQKTPIFSSTFTAQPMSAVTDTINYIINSLNAGRIEQRETPFPVPARTFENPFPFYYRPSEEIRRYIGITPTVDSNGTFEFIKNLNANLLVTSVKFARAYFDRDGSGLVSQKNKFGISNFVEAITNSETEWTANRNSVSVMGSNKIILLSHESIVPGKGAVNLNVDGETSTIYGLGQDQIFGNVFDNTEPMVRGQKLKEFLSLITMFVTTHTHDFPGNPPVPISYSGVDIDTIEQAFQNYDDTVLNQNIRIN